MLHRRRLPHQISPNQQTKASGGPRKALRPPLSPAPIAPFSLGASESAQSAAGWVPPARSHATPRAARRCLTLRYSNTRPRGSRAHFSQWNRTPTTSRAITPGLTLPCVARLLQPAGKPGEEDARLVTADAPATPKAADSPLSSRQQYMILRHRATASCKLQAATRTLKKALIFKGSFKNRPKRASALCSNPPKLGAQTTMPPSASSNSISISRSQQFSLTRGPPTPSLSREM